jgi:hypothetical protein
MRVDPKYAHVLCVMVNGNYGQLSRV